MTPTIVVENDPVLRILSVLLDPESPPDRRAAFAEYVAHDVPDFDAWAKATLDAAPSLHPARVILVDDAAALHAALPEADLLVREELPVDAQTLAAAPRMRAIQHFGALVRDVDLPACAARGIEVATQPRRTNLAVAEHTIAMLLSLAKRLPEIGGRVTFDRLRAAGFSPGEFRSGHTANANWGRVPGLLTISNATLGVIGLGEIGREVARLGTALGMTVLYTQRTRAGPEEEARAGAEFVAFPDLLARADAISLHVPKTVTGLMNAAAFAAMKPGAVLVNTARADCVDRAAMVDALATGRLARAAFDVLWQEPAADDDPLLDDPRFLLTPHLAGGSRLNGLGDIAEMLALLSRALA